MLRVGESGSTRDAVRSGPLLLLPDTGKPSASVDPGRRVMATVQIYEPSTFTWVRACLCLQMGQKTLQAMPCHTPAQMHHTLCRQTPPCRDGKPPCSRG